MRHRIKPGKWPYWLGGMAAVLGVGGGVVMIIMSVVAMASFSPHRMLAPGTSHASLAHKGSHCIYHEYLSIYNGRKVRTRWSQRERVWETLRVSVTNAGTGEKIDVETSSVRSTYKLMNKYAGKKLYSFSVPAATEVKITASYEDGWRGPKVVLAVGQMKVLRFVVLLTAGIFAVVGGLSIALPVILVTVFLRVQSRQRLEKQGLL